VKKAVKNLSGGFTEEKKNGENTFEKKTFLK